MSRNSRCIGKILQAVKEASGAQLEDRLDDILYSFAEEVEEDVPQGVPEEVPVIPEEIFPALRVFADAYRASFPAVLSLPENFSIGGLPAGREITIGDLKAVVSFLEQYDG